MAKKYHVNKIGVFASITRQDFSKNSNIDILVDFTEPIGIAFIELADYLELIVNRKVNLISKKSISECFYAKIKDEVQYI